MDRTHPKFLGNQIWFDLLLFAATALYFIVPKARKLGMNLPFWLLLSLATGSMGLLAMLARMFYLAQLEDKQKKAPLSRNANGKGAF